MRYLIILGLILLTILVGYTVGLSQGVGPPEPDASCRRVLVYGGVQNDAHIWLMGFACPVRES